MLKLISYVILAYFLYTIWRLVRAIRQRTIPPRRPRARLSGTMVKDAVCNTYIPKEEALRETFDGREYFFCSKDCRKKFHQDRKRP